MRPQADYVFADGRLLVDEIVRFERLHEEFGRIAARVGLKTPLPHVNRSGRAGKKRSKSLFPWLHPDRRESHDHWKAFYAGDTADMVGRLYEKDAAAFGYAFDN